MVIAEEDVDMERGETVATDMVESEELEDWVLSGDDVSVEGELATWLL